MDDLNFNIYNILIFSGIIQGIIFSSVVLFNRKYKSRTNQYIAFTVLALSFSNLQYWFVDVHLEGFFSVFKELRIPFDILIVPMFYMFVNNYLQNSYPRYLLYYLLTPFILNTVLNFILYSEGLNSVLAPREINVGIEIFSFLFNLFLIMMLLRKIHLYERNNDAYHKTKIKTRTKWLKQILYVGGIMCILWFSELLIYSNTNNNNGLKLYYPLWISISFLIYWISYIAIFNSKISKERQVLREYTVSKAIKETEKFDSKKTNTKLFDEICHRIITNKSYLNPELNVSALAEEFKISNGYLSQLFSANTELNFNEFINKLRVEEAKTLLDNPEYDNYTILAIGLESGFNSKSSFYSAFKKFTGNTPNTYKK